MLDLTRQALESLTTAVLVPAVAKTGEVDDYVRAVKRGIVEFVARRYKAPKEVLARHFSKSDRWVYRQLEEAIKARQEAGDEPDGQSLLIDVINFFQEQYPEAATPGQCARALKRRGWTINGAELEPVLGLYEKMGFLQQVPGEGGDVSSYRVSSRNLKHTAANAEERAALLEKHSEVLLPLAISYLRGDPGARFGLSKASVLARHFVDAMRDVRQYQVKRIIKAVEDTLKDDPDEKEPRVTFASLLVAGVLSAPEAEEGAPTPSQETP